ncbi:hypothetical protein C7974DRAFT_409265 [Boeremia exigua]|uniref:uncharacterized protein n=1 Tax=Boeremia exigua TaxID=749465 RepID=UPI001E8ED6F3|nr:uncharacterized protein C7974DRAFT_409265 [Boeremia exigua]KAH6642731.1 hypothetical protein C7974DRAFT_409265 [Boeremia exigua]
MRFSKITYLSMLALTSSAIASPPAVENLETSLEANQDANALEKRFGPIVILLVKVIGGQLLAGAAKIAVDATKAKLEPEGDSFKDFDAARTAFTQELVKDLYNHRSPSTIKGVACYNGPYEFSSGAHYEGPVSVNFKWDIYHTDYDCFELFSGTVHNKGDGGYINTAVFGTCHFDRGSYTC